RTNQIATHCHLARLQIDTDAGSLEWSAPFVYFRKIVSQDRHIGYFTSRMEPVGYGYQPSVPSHTGQFIHIGVFAYCRSVLSPNDFTAQSAIPSPSMMMCFISFFFIRL